MTELTAHLEAQNASRAAWVAESPNTRFATMWETDAESWAARGITTVAHFERYLLVSEFWDLYKDLYGSRPRHMNIDAMSDEELAAEIERLGDAMKAEIERQDAEAMQEEDEIAALCGAQGIDRATYDRWQADAEQPVFA